MLAPFAQFADELRPLTVGEPQIQHRHVHRLRRKRLARPGQRAGLGDDLEIRLALEGGGEEFAEDGVVLHEQHAHRGHRGPHRRPHRSTVIACVRLSHTGILSGRSGGPKRPRFSVPWWW